MSPADSTIVSGSVCLLLLYASMQMCKHFTLHTLTHTTHPTPSHSTPLTPTQVPHREMKKIQSKWEQHLKPLIKKKVRTEPTWS